jgi:hypothetical protein
MVEIGPCRPLRDAEHRTDFYVRESFHIVQDDHRPLSCRQRLQRASQPVLQLVGLRGIAERNCHSLRQDVGVAHPTPAADVQRCVRHDPVQPRAERLLRPEARDRPVGVQKRILYRILGTSCVAVIARATAYARR